MTKREQAETKRGLDSVSDPENNSLNIQHQTQQTGEDMRKTKAQFVNITTQSNNTKTLHCNLQNKVAEKLQQKERYREKAEHYI